MSIDKNISLDTFAEYGWLSVNAVEVCKKNNLNNFIALVGLYRRFGNNLNYLKDSNTELLYELTIICRHFETFSLEEIAVEIQDYFSLIDIVQFSNLEIKNILDRYVANAISSISVRARNGLYSLFNTVPTTELLVRRIFAPQFNFFKIKNMGIKTVNELEEFKTNLFEFIQQFTEDIQNKSVGEPKTHIKTEFDETLQVIENFSPHKKLTLNRHIDYLVSKLQVRPQNAILSLLQETNNKRNLLNLIFSPSFKFDKLINVGNKTIQELEFFKVNIENYVREIQNLKDEDLSKEFSILIIKSSFKNVIEVYPNIFNEAFNDEGKIKLFKLILILINTGFIVKKDRSEIFLLEYTNHYSKDIIQIGQELELTKERIRQIKAKLKDTFETYFGFILNFKIDDLLLYDTLMTDNYKVIDNNFIGKINSNEETNFNVNFYCKILHILHKDSFSIIGIEETNTRSKLVLKKIEELKNKYLIRNSIYNSFDFIGFINDVDSKLSDKITETYEFHFQGYLFQFLIANDTSNIEKIREVCEAILYNEFEMVVDISGYIAFERNTFKQIYEYCYEILEKNSQQMTIAEIQNIFNQQYPELMTTIDSIRGSINREKEMFIFYGRRSTYGLRKWEQEKENHKGGTIRDIVEEFLINEEQPKHITEIIDFVKKYRKTNSRNVLSNLKLDASKRFTFFKSEYVGVSTKIYDKSKFKEINKPTKWNDRFQEFKQYWENNKGILPRSSSTDKQEKLLYSFFYKTKIAYKQNKLEIEKFDLLLSIDFPFEEAPQVVEDWETKLSNLITFVAKEHSLPKVNSSSKIERTLYRFWYFTRKDYLNNKLTQEQVEKLKQSNLSI